MSDIECPYCKKDQEVMHDEGQGYDEEENQHTCISCDRDFIFATSVSYYYEVSCNTENDHVWEQSPVEGCEDFYTCANCETCKVERGNDE